MGDTCNIALFGQKFMGRVHSNAYAQAPKFFNLPLQPVLHTIVGRDLISLAPFADRWQWQEYNTSWKEVVKDNAIDVVDICTPNAMHAEQALAALSNSKHVACEKPLAGTLKEARQMKNAAARGRKTKTFVWFHYRRCPAVALARQLIADGKLGRIYHVRANYLQDWATPDVPLLWRFQKKYAGYGAHGDLNAHIVDLARFLTGEDIVEILGAASETFITEREVLEQSTKSRSRVRSSRRKKQKGKPDVDDATLFLARFTGGALASFEASRVATGHHNDHTIEINGEQGAIRFSLNNINELWYINPDDEPAISGWRRIVCTEAHEHPYAGAWWPDHYGIGYEHTYVHMVADMMAVLAGQEPLLPLPDFADAYEVQRVMEAALLAAKNRAAVKMTDIK